VSAEGAGVGAHDGGALEATVSLAIQESELQLAVKEVRFFRQILQPAGAPQAASGAPQPS
jgi:hypothetical protein